MLPNLHVFSFRGVSAYLDLIQASESLSFSGVKLTFNKHFLDFMADPDQSWQR